MLVSQRQEGNAVLRHIRNVRWAFADLVPDYILGPTACAIFISLRYHVLHPQYLGKAVHVEPMKPTYVESVSKQALETTTS